MPSLPHALLLAAAGLATIPVLAGAAPADPLASHRWKDRVVLVLAPDGADPQLRQQRDILERMGAAARDRDLKLVVVVGDTPAATALRQRFGIGGGFRAVLIGKDGGAKLDADAPLGPDALVPLIDAMPMRQGEVGRRP